MTSTMHTQPVLEAIDIKRSFTNGTVEVHAVRGVSLRVCQGEFVGLIGPSGCGKSTLLSLLGLLETPSSGEIVLEGVSTRNASPKLLERLRREKIGFVFQSFNLLPTLSVEENIMLPCIVTGVSEATARSRAHELAERLGVARRLSAMPATLSGGEMQRVAIARALSHRPAVILADEPTGNLDSVTGDTVLSLLEEVHNEGTPIIMVTHSERAAARCTRVVSMHDGVLVDDL